MSALYSEPRLVQPCSSRNVSIIRKAGDACYSFYLRGLFIMRMLHMENGSWIWELIGFMKLCYVYIVDWLGVLACGYLFRGRVTVWYV